MTWNEVEQLTEGFIIFDKTLQNTSLVKFFQIWAFHLYLLAAPESAWPRSHLTLLFVSQNAVNAVSEIVHERLRQVPLLTLGLLVFDNFAFGNIFILFSSNFSFQILYQIVTAQEIFLKEIFDQMWKSSWVFVRLIKSLLNVRSKLLLVIFWFIHIDGSFALFEPPYDFFHKLWFFSSQSLSLLHILLFEIGVMHFACWHLIFHLIVTLPHHAFLHSSPLDYWPAILWRILSQKFRILPWFIIIRGIRPRRHNRGELIKLRLHLTLKIRNGVWVVYQSWLNRSVAWFIRRFESLGRLFSSYSTLASQIYRDLLLPVYLAKNVVVVICSAILSHYRCVIQRIIFWNLHVCCSVYSHLSGNVLLVFGVNGAIWVTGDVDTSRGLYHWGHLSLSLQTDVVRVKLSTPLIQGVFLADHLWGRPIFKSHSCGV